jgi:type IV pilus biogenesis protein PilP
MGLFGGDNSGKPSSMQMQPTAASKVTGGSQTQMTAGVPSGNGIMNPAMMPGQQSSNPQAQPVKAVVPNEQQVIIAQQQDTQKEYVDTINQLQMLKLQKDIDETKQSIATARLATATAEKNITDLLTKPAPSVNNNMPPADYAKMLGGSGQNIPPPPLQVVPQVQYVVISVSMRLGHWMAVLGNQGKLYSVSVGDTLPVDGSEVVAIGKDGVVLKKDNMKRKINIVNSI